MSKTQSKLGVTITNKYLVYTALLTQTGADDPVATVLENTIGAIVWDYAAAGDYTGTLLGAFPVATTWVIINQWDDDTFKNSIARTNDNIIRVRTYDTGVLTDVILSATSIEIRVYI